MGWPRKQTYLRNEQSSIAANGGYPLRPPTNTLTTITAPNGVGAGMLAHDGILYFSEYGLNKIRAYDLSDPLNPSLISEWDTTDTQPRWFEVHDNIYADRDWET